MIEQTISKIEERLRHSRTLGPDDKAELEALLGQLRAEASGLVGQPTAAAAGSTPSLAADLGASVAGFEQSHPRLIELVNRISTTLANLGI